jgi:hypothetical protein
MMTAAALAAVIVFLLVSLPPEPRFVQIADAALAQRTVAGAYHVHSVRSDGSGDRQAIAAAAARAGLKFVIITDHGDGTRVPDPPAYIAGVLCIDAVEISTTGGHYVALGLGLAPYPLGGEAGAVIEDVSRLGGFGFAAHPDSSRPELAWSDWTLPFDGIEWMNADSEWRNETRPRLARVVFDYLLRPGPALASILDRPVANLAHWDALTSTRQVSSIAGHDAHGGIGRSAEYRGTGQSTWLPGVPSYEASFRSFSTRVVLEGGLSGDALADASMLLAAIRAGRMFTSIDAIAAPALLDFGAVRGPTRVSMGDTVAPGPASFKVNAPVPEGARTVLLHNGEPLAQADGGALALEVAAAEGAYRVEMLVHGSPGNPPVPWMLSNPIYFRETQAALHPPNPLRSVPLAEGMSWHVEKDRGSTGSVVTSPAEVAFYYRLRGPSRTSQFAAAVAELQGRAAATGAITFTAAAVRPARLSVQLRYAGGQRWARSIYLDPTPRDIVVPIAAMRPADHQIGRQPAATAAVSLLFVVDLTNALPGAANTVRISNVGFAPAP